jgi:hypothetical protein
VMRMQASSACRCDPRRENGVAPRKPRQPSPSRR